MKRKTVFLYLAAFTGGLLFASASHPLLAYPLKTGLLQPQAQVYLAKAPITYQIRLGDTLFGIAQTYNITLEKLLSFNPDFQDNPDLIRVGDKINVPASTQPSSVTPKPPVAVQTPPKHSRVRVVQKPAQPDTTAQKPAQPSRVRVVQTPHQPYRSVQKPAQPDTTAQKPAQPSRVRVVQTPHQTSRSVQKPAQPNTTAQKPAQPSRNAQKPAQPNTTAQTPSRSRPQTFANLNIPSERRMGNNRVGAKRGTEACTKKPNDDLKALLPETNFGYTLLDHPTFFWYMPELTAQNIPLKFSIREVNRNEKGKESFKPLEETTLQNKGSGVMSFTLSDKVPSLKEGQEYEWEVKIECSDIDWIWTSGRIKRLSTDNPTLADKLAKAPIDDYPAIYAKEGVWYDALSTLAALQKEQPSNTDLKTDWAEILKMIGFNDIADKRLIEPSKSQ